jgi:hypothetical protein
MNTVRGFSHLPIRSYRRHFVFNIEGNREITKEKGLGKESEKETKRREKGSPTGPERTNEFFWDSMKLNQGIPQSN